MATNLVTFRKGSGLQIFCKKRDRERESDRYPYRVIEITPPPKNLGIRCFPSRGVKSTKCQYPAIKFAFIVGKGKLCQRGAARIGRWKDGCISFGPIVLDYNTRRSVISFWKIIASIASNRCPSPRKRVLLERQLLIPAYVSLITGERAFIERLDNSKQTSRMDSFGGGCVISPIN